MNQFLSNKIIAGIVALALLVGVGVLVSSGDTSSTTRNAALVVATPCTKPGQVTKVSKQSVVCATTNTGSLWYATMKAKGKAQACKSPGEIRKKSDIVWVCGVIKKKTLWQATQPLPPAVVASTTVIELGATQPTPALDSTQVATPLVPIVADNTVLADTKIPDDKIVTKVIEDVTTPTVAPTTPAPSTPSTPTTVKEPTSTTTITLPLTQGNNGCGPYSAFTVTGTTGGTVWGSGPYTDDSEFGAAAVHAGLIEVGKTAVIEPYAVDNYSMYEGTRKNDVATTNYAENWCGFYIKLLGSPTPSPKTCATGGTCEVGDIGPGGGIVFYVSPTPFTCGEDLKAKCTYLEAAIANGTTTSTWTRDTRAEWGCKDINVMTPDQRTASLEIGAGRANTKIITGNTCNGPTSAASIAKAYNGGNKTDWFLPSYLELNELCKYARQTSQAVGPYASCEKGRPRTGFATAFYWSSSESSATSAKLPNLTLGGQNHSGKGDSPYVLPVRAFSPTIALTCATGGTCKLRDIGPGGGIVFYAATTAQSWGTYLEAAPTDYQVNGSRKSVAWGCDGTSTGATATAIGTGEANTNKILAECNTAGIAADVAKKYSTTNTVNAPGAAGQWFLPSKDELNEMCKIYSNGRTDTTGWSAKQNGCTGNTSPTGGFATGAYWSSSEGNGGGAWGQAFNVGIQDNIYRAGSAYYVRPVRAF